MPSIETSVKAGKEARENGSIKPLPAPDTLKPVPVADWPPGPNSYSRGPLPSTYVDRADTQRHFQTGAVPQARIPPISATSNPVVGAQSASQAIQVNQTVTSSTSGPLVSLQIPSIFTPTLQTESPTGLLAFSLASESPHNFFAGPAPNAALYVDASNVVTTFSSLISTTATPNQSSTDFAMVFTAQDAAGTLFAPGGSWVSQFSSGTSTAFSQQLSSFNSVTASNSISVASSWSSALILFGSNGSASVLHANTLLSGNFGSSSQTPPSASTAGSTLILVRYSTTLFGTVPTISAVTDTQGNQWFQAATAGNLSSSGTAISVWFAPNAVGGSNTITWTQVGGGTSGNMEYFEVSNLTGFPGIPVFRAITGADLPLPTTTSLGAAYASTSAGSQFLTGLGTNGRFTQAQPAFTDISGNIATTQMNSGTNADDLHFFRGDGAWARLAVTALDVTGNTANIGSTAITPALSPGQTGMYRISVYCIVAQAATTSSTLPDCLISWVDGSNTTTQTIDFVSSAPTGNTLTTYFQGSVVVHLNSAHVALTYQTGSVTSYTSVGGVVMKYDLFIRVEAI
jgi:hypothetical protein